MGYTFFEDYEFQTLGMGDSFAWNLWSTTACSTRGSKIDTSNTCSTWEAGGLGNVLEAGLIRVAAAST